MDFPSSIGGVFTIQAGDMDLFHLFIILLTGISGGIFGTLTGGAGLIQIPALVFLGLSPHSAIGTHFFGVTGLNVTGWYKFHEKRMINYKIGFIVTIPVFLGSILGANIVFQMDEAILKKIITILTMAILFFIVFNPGIGLKRSKETIRTYEYFLGIFLSFAVGVYNGFYSSVSGAFLAYILILLFGQTFLESAATRKIPMTLSSGVAAAIFAMKGAIFYPMGIGLLISSSVGAYFAAKYSDKIGNVWIKRLFFVVVFIMAIKLIIS